MDFQIIYNKAITDLFHKLPGVTKEKIDCSSRLIDEIIGMINDYPDVDMYFLENGDVWRYNENEHDIFNHPKFTNKIVFLHHIGYETNVLSDKKYKISFPTLYFTRDVPPLIIKDKNLPYGFSCLNNNNQTHRLILGNKFYENNLLTDIIFTQNNRYPNKRMPASLNEYASLLPITWKDNDSDFWYNKLDYSVNHDAYNQAYANIVTESDVDHPIVSEKTFKPFISGQVPIILGPVGHLNYLKGLGFECMEDLLPQNYDYMNVHQKIDSIVNLVKLGKEHIKDFYFNNLDKIKYNYELVNSKKVDDLIIKRITDLF